MCEDARVYMKKKLKELSLASENGRVFYSFCFRNVFFWSDFLEQERWLNIPYKFSKLKYCHNEKHWRTSVLNELLAAVCGLLN